MNDAIRPCFSHFFWNALKIKNIKTLVATRKFRELIWQSLMANCVEDFSGNAHGFVFDKDDVVVMHVTGKALLNLRWYDKVIQ